MKKLSLTTLAYGSIALQVSLFILAPNFLLKAFYNADDPWSSALVGYVFLIVTAVMFPLLDLGIVISAQRGKGSAQHRRSLLICQIIFALSLLQAGYLLFGNTVRYWLLRG
jgi:hypothetical protein